MKNFIFLISFLLFQAGATGQSPILLDYLTVKDALVASNPDGAEQGAKKLAKSIQSFDSNTLSPEAKKIFTQQKSNLIKLSESIGSTNDLEKQRSKFAELSVILWPIVKITATPDQILYYDYCPMKQTYWISIDAPIKNPYYGSKMLSCGNISEKSSQ